MDVAGAVWYDTAMHDTIVTVHGVSRRFHHGGETVYALRDVSLTIDQGEIVLIEGKSGSGKTTLLNLMGGLDSPTEGQILFRGEDLAKRSRRELTRWRRTSVGFIFQAFALIEGLTALENVETAARIGGMSPRRATETSTEQLAQVGLGKRLNHRIAELSGGEQQRVALARGLVCHREIVFADEPTGELDHAMSRRVLELLRQVVAERNITICLTSHDPAVQAFADRVYRLADGQLIQGRAS